MSAIISDMNVLIVESNNVAGNGRDLAGRNKDGFLGRSRVDLRLGRACN